ncbi:caspase family protein [Marinovum sp. 2_MG-2023]|uniref:caspase family protein n=1 Tax=unclassified Marinovum TaxID=2647166 RepID=UPI0026E25103|nr:MULTISPECIES: caspase family protein [unclassified Marinovum]MDO6728618.1 caspase family protein [Marinovum sp. 2_MG-2023]MDO6777966.1 caspase family protein [Marinovum sp. 1_MG-2023]
MVLRFLITVVMSVLALTAAAETRVALVIGNSAYENAPRLDNPERDATAIADRLKQVGFEVTLGIDLDYRGFRRLIGKFAREASNSDISLVYFAGHGIELSGENYLIPTDALLEHEAEADIESISLQTLVEKAALARQLSIIMVDACRDNPWVSSIERLDKTRSLSRGLAPLPDPGRGQVVSFATAPGQTAADGEGDHSPYAESLLELLDEPGVEISFFFRRLRDSVRARTDGEQTPIFESDLPGREIHLVPPIAKDAEAETSDATGPATAEVEGENAGTSDNEFFESSFRTSVEELTECDRLAGYAWHPRVPGGSIAYDAIEPERALAACQQAILDYPEEWFFYFLAGRAIWVGDDDDPRIRRYMELGGRADPAFAYERLGVIAEHGYGGMEASVSEAAEFYQKSMEAGYQSAILSLASLYVDATPPNYDLAMDYYDQALAMGLRSAPNALGKLHLDGKLPDSSDAEALRYFTMGCDNGYMTSCGNLGWMHSNDRAPESDLAAAIDYLTMACDADEGFACRSLAHVHINKRIDGASDAEALRLFTKGCDLGDTNACGNVGWMHSRGRVENPDLQVAVAKLSRACELDETWACRSLGYIHKNKRIDGASDAEALRLFARACAGGDENGCGMEGWMHKAGRAPEPDMQLALARLSATCGPEEAWTCSNVGNLYQDGSLGTPDFETAAEWYEKGCGLSDGRSCGWLGEMLEYGTLGEEDFEGALTYFTRGCVLENGWSCARAGWFHAEGAGTAENHELAAEFFQKGCDDGNAWGCGRLAGLYYRGEGVTQDFPQSFELALQSCEGDTGFYCGHAAGMLELEDVPADPVRGLALRKKACTLRHAYSCGRLAWGPYADLGADAEDRGTYLVLSLEYGSRFVIENYKSFDRALARELQQALKARGYYTGAVDGVLGRGSLAALERAYAA